MITAFTKRAIIAISLFSALFGFSLSAHASEVGNAAWVLFDTTLSSGPGTQYPQTALTLDQGDAVIVARCSSRWCRIANTEGWLSIDKLSFGRQARTPFFSIKASTPEDVDAEVCLFSGENYTGTAVCLPAGSTIRDLALTNFDNTIASVSVQGDASVNLCRDANFSSYCVRYDQSAPQIDRLLSNAVSSYRVY